jgi:tRNA-specific 2-thiouridylase
MARKRVLVGMSGGVDSSVAALLLLEQGFAPVGMTAALFGDASACGPCCGREGAQSAAHVCTALGIEHVTCDLSALFEEQVIARFISEYQAGRTPNPCSDCNRFIKFATFFDIAAEHGCHHIATGHHARIGPHSGTDQPVLLTGRDRAKDQSYFLACIPPERLPRIHFPVGAYTKAEVRRLAAAAGLPTASRDESQDICFLPPDTGIRELLLWHTGREPQPGPIVDLAGNELGRHPGIEHFTIGQRKGLRLGGGSEGLVVHELRPESATVVVARAAEHPVARLRLAAVTDMAPGLWQPGAEVQVRARYRQPLWPARVEHDGAGALSIVPATTVHSIACGQWLVGYAGDSVLFGGIVDAVEYRC